MPTLSRCSTQDEPRDPRLRSGGDAVRAPAEQAGLADGASAGRARAGPAGQGRADPRAVASQGRGVFDTLKAVLKLVLGDLRRPLTPRPDSLDTPRAVSKLRHLPRVNLWLGTGSGPIRTAEGSRAEAPSMYAVIETGGKQQRVEVGQVVRVERMPSEIMATCRMHSPLH